MKILVCGGRDFMDRDAVIRTLDQAKKERGVSLIIEGGAEGADKLAGLWADSSAIPRCTMKANWAAFGKSAGPKRNQAMLDLLLPDGVIAFPGGKGTEDMVRRAEKQGVPVWKPLG